MRISIEATGEHLAFDSHPAALDLLTELVDGRTLSGWEPDEWGAWVTWNELVETLDAGERATVGFARAIAGIETIGGIPARVTPMARVAAEWALGGA
jgi:hypothetical protein